MKNIHEPNGERLMNEEAKGRESPLERIKKTGGVAHPVKQRMGRPADSMLAVYRDRFTYTFILDKEVASIHFDRSKKEIFFRGHNILKMVLSPEQVRALKSAQEVLEDDEQGKLLFNEYVATLGGLLADKYKSAQVRSA
ncbi:MAG: hypothetical protein COV46_05015 [Deltaproteobacteria bacterium CG11_big_fil_rev_8_21_14_0_20_49_13]|nr:MAG: hypothetical protein COV46_05015 [Deltaproteobacteria bacterium CG11_big_fil_rev_8_21_14_0_20_49_13]